MKRIAFISDIHYGKLSRTTELSVPGEAIKDENSGGEPFKEGMISLLKKENIEYLCVAGDLTSEGSPQEFCYCEKMLIEIAERIGLPMENLFVGLGNHDIDWKIAELYNNFNSEDAAFPMDLVKDKYRKIAVSASRVNMDSISTPLDEGPAPLSGVIENENFVMFLLNTGWCCTRDQAFSHGRLDEVQLKWFKNESAKYKDSSKWKIVLMHHHPFNYKYHVPAVDISTLEEGSELLEIAGENGIHLILHGHRHHPKAETNMKTGWKHPITFVCAGSFAVNASHRASGAIPNTLHIIELTDEIGVIKLYNYQYSCAQGWIPFVTNSPETPLDKEMLFGKLFSEEQIELALKKITVPSELHWNNLDECLKFMSFPELNEKIESYFKAECKKIGSFPEDVYLLERSVQK